MLPDHPHNRRPHATAPHDPDHSLSLDARSSPGSQPALNLAANRFWELSAMWFGSRSGPRGGIIGRTLIRTRSARALAVFR